MLATGVERARRPCRPANTCFTSQQLSQGFVPRMKLSMEEVSAVRSILLIVAAAVCGAAPPAAQAQGFYKCSLRVYSQEPCSKHLVNTDEAPVPASGLRSKAIPVTRDFF